MIVPGPYLGMRLFSVGRELAHAQSLVPKCTFFAVCFMDGLVGKQVRCLCTSRSDPRICIYPLLSRRM